VHAAQPVYRLFSCAEFLRTHVNVDPGTHNFDKDNREALYRLIGDHFFPGVVDFARADIAPEKGELKTPAELTVPMPERNETLNSLAVRISRSLPMPAQARAGVPFVGTQHSESRRRLRRIVRYEVLDAEAIEVEKGAFDPIDASFWHIRFNDRWTSPVVVFDMPNARSTAVVCCDKGRNELGQTVERLVKAGERVVAIDLFNFGEAKGTIDGYEITLIATVGHRLIGIQAAQLAGTARWIMQKHPGSRVRLVADGPRTSVIALVAAALEPTVVTGVETNGAWQSLKEAIARNMDVRDAPELFCFGLLKEFDLAQIEVLAAPRTGSHTSP
jgi:hypothetical protein